LRPCGRCRCGHQEDRGHCCEAFHPINGSGAVRSWQ
jgi:hypothetical protein